MRAEGKFGQLGNLPRRALGKLRMRVQAGSDRRSANCQVVQSIQRLFESFDVTLQQAGPTAELLSNGERDSVLQVRASDFHDVVELIRLRCDRIAHRADRWDQ